MTRKGGLACAAAAALLFPCVEAAAMPLFNIRLLGRNQTTNPGGAFTSALVFSPGDVIEFQVLTGLANIGAVNGTRTITSKTDGTDGVQNLKFNIYDPTDDDVELGAFSPLTLNAAGGWGNVIGASGGVPDGNSVGENSLDNVRPGQASGVFAAGTANGEVVVATGQVTALNTAGFGPSFLRVGINQPQNINTVSAAAVRINGATVLAVTTISEAGADPLIGLIPLSTFPEPSGLGLLALAGVVLRRRARTVRRGEFA